MAGDDLSHGAVAPEHQGYAMVEVRIGLEDFRPKEIDKELQKTKGIKIS
jgi:hypothetical protein